MTLRSTTLRPGLLVGLKTSVRGNVAYDKRTLEEEHILVGGMARAKWETVRTIDDPAEHEAAEKARSKAGSVIRSVCAKSAFGLLCPESLASQLEGAVTEARAIADTFNATAKLSHVDVYVITGRVAPDDVEAVRAINSEIKELLDTMETGCRNLDPEAIREAASKARSVGAMLPAETQARVKGAIDAARSAARQIVKAGEAAAVEVDAGAIKRIMEARTSFLDLDTAPAEVAATVETARAIDLDPALGELPDFQAAAPAPAFALEME
jgi:ElaB/YqjD/DUF883 family membrane-anchored ribosome-binding protein